MGSLNLEILEIFTTTFSLKTIIWTSFSFFQKILSKKMPKHWKTRENEKQEKAKQTQKNVFTFTFLYGKIYILLENIFGET